ncbi:MAG: SCP2 sterol-binding domain-containing protein [Cyanobacteria bacterium SZAS LIN-3]|nr:SCP2 sterol-binding domain-containing protein [Cyanobacteria bacterium SZAS LIN-3]
MQATNTIEELKRRFRPEAARNLTATYLIHVKGPNGGAWLTAIKEGTCDIMESAPGAPADCTIAIEGDDLEAILSGRMSAMTAALSGVLQIGGELGLAMQLVPIFFDGGPF